jgi:hypothetical protein
MEKQRGHVIVSREEKVMLLRNYIAYSCNWDDILGGMSENRHLLTAKVREHYETQPRDKLKRRLRDLFRKIVDDSDYSVDDDELADLVEKIKDNQQRYIRKVNDKCMAMMYTDEAIPRWRSIMKL